MIPNDDEVCQQRPQSDDAQREDESFVRSHVAWLRG